MSRSLDQGDGDLRQQQQNIQNRLAVVRGGSGGHVEEPRLAKPDPRASDGGTNSAAELLSVIDQATADKPTMSEFVDRLELKGVWVVPSFQLSGRLNGMSYRYRGTTLKGSTLGRAYTAQGLQTRKGVRYEALRDDPALRKSLEKAGLRRIYLLDSRPESQHEINRNGAGRVRDHATGLSFDQKATLNEIGRFRTVRTEDLVQHRYGGNAARFRQDLRVLSDQGLAERRTVKHSKSGREYSVAVLTQRGRNLVRRMERDKASSEPAQQFHAGFVKPAEVRHDIGIYRMYQVERNQIENDGGAVRRVVLDFELKKEVFAKLNAGTERSSPDYNDRKAEIAGEHGLRVIDGRIVFPDLRIEFQTRDQQTARVDLELATADYKNSQIQAKHAAGLKIYGPDSSAGSPALLDPEIVSGPISI